MSQKKNYFRHLFPLFVVTALSGCATNGAPTTGVGQFLMAASTMMNGNAAQTARQAGRIIAQQEALAQQQRQAEERQARAQEHQRWLASLSSSERLAYERDVQRRQAAQMQTVGSAIQTFGEMFRQPDVIILR